MPIADLSDIPFGASWGADDMILYGQPESIMQVPGAGGTPELLIPVEEGERMHGAQMLPGRECVLFTVRAYSASCGTCVNWFEELTRLVPVL